VVAEAVIRVHFLVLDTRVSTVDWHADDGKVYYLADDGEKVSEMPDKYAWKELVSDEHDGAKYYFNEKTGLFPRCLLPDSTL
jgi:hypothetical protein